MFKKGQVLVAGNRRWGAGGSMGEAKRNWRDQGGRPADGYTVVTFDADTEFHGVDQMGNYLYAGNEPIVKHVEPRKVARRVR